MLKVLEQIKRLFSFTIAGGIFLILFAFPYWNQQISKLIRSAFPLMIRNLTYEVDRNQENLDEMYGMVNLGLHYDKSQYAHHLSLIIPTKVVSPVQVEKENSDLFYYVLGIIILIISAFIFKQRYKQFLDEKRNKR